jgi:hypothetical protein
MAECSLETITITGADGFTDANGVYTKQSANSYINPNGVTLVHSDGGSFGTGWYVVKIFPRYFAAQDPADCPSGLTFNGTIGTVGSFTLAGDTPTPSQPTFGLAADVVALITSRFGTVANFLRLRNQGQV